MWNDDMSTAPLGKEVTVTRQVTVDGKKQDRKFREHHVAPVWLATSDGKVQRSYLIPTLKGVPGRWAGFNEGSALPIAWQEFVTPKHPNAVSDLGLNIVTKSTEFGIIPHAKGSAA